MPDWGEILQEINAEGSAPTGPGSPLDRVRRNYLVRLGDYTKRPVILYATKWTQGPVPPDLISIGAGDLQGLMEVMRGAPAGSVDLVMHSPGGSIEAAEAMVSYLRSKFDHVRVIVPQAAMSAACMIACAADEIVMGKHSFLGPTDPQLIMATPLGPRTVAAQAIKSQFDFIRKECTDPTKMAAFVPMLSQYGPDLLQLCENAIDLSRTLVQQWLEKYMFKGQDKGSEKAAHIAAWLADQKHQKTHGRFLNREVLRGEGLPITDLEGDQQLQDLVLSVFHATTHTFENSGTVKVIENNRGRAYMRAIPMQAPGRMPGPAGFFVAPPIGGLQVDGQ